MLRAEQLAVEIEPGGLYEVSWLVRKITGFSAGEQEKVSAPGDALLRDLSAFVERLCEMGAGPSFEEAQRADFETVESLVRRWNVSRRTLERWRRIGLVARRVRDAEGQTRLIFASGVIEAFEYRRSPQIARARKFARAPVVDRAKIPALAERCVRRFGWSHAECAARISARRGLKPEVVRRIIESSRDAARGVASPARPLDHRAGVAALRALERGIDPGVIAMRWRKPVRLVRRAIEVARLRRLGPVADSFPTLPSDAPGEGAIRAVSGAGHDLLQTSPRGLSEFLAWASAKGPPDRRRESALASCALALRARVKASMATISMANPRLGDVDRIETDVRAIALLWSLLLEDQAPTVIRALEVRIGGKLDRLGAPVSGLLQEAMASAVMAITRFDPSRGGRLAGRVALEVDRASSAWLRRRQLVTGPEAHGERAIRAISRSAPAPRAIFEPSPGLMAIRGDRRLAAGLSALDDAHERALRLRLGIGFFPRTLGEIGEALGVSRLRAGVMVREATRDALVSVRGAQPDSGLAMTA